eukprot:GHRR01032958.1.p1 GENE.GHRR01032958.1~~GHRR01032958.1.p1  ORF type:complete len:126 (-),score=11.88 GHRR01032958.1:118-495(-)
MQVCNLELLSEVEALAQDLLDSGKPINLLINNAARFLDAPFKVTKEGFEQTISIGCEYCDGARIAVLAPYLSCAELHGVHACRRCFRTRRFACFAVVALSIRASVSVDRDSIIIAHARMSIDSMQ